MTTQNLKDFHLLANVVAELVRRSGAAYGSPEEWRHDFTAVVHLSERLGLQLIDAQPTREERDTA